MPAGAGGAARLTPLLPPAVLADALQVGAVAPPEPGLSLRLGEPFELRCSASTASPLHTHLALLWELQRGTARRSVLALTHEGRFRPGPGYEQRYRVGDVRLDTVGADGYRLSVARALAADQGSYRCVVSEWIGEQGSWQEIQEKAVDVATVLIQPTGELLGLIRLAPWPVFWPVPGKETGGRESCPLLTGHLRPGFEGMGD